MVETPGVLPKRLPPEFLFRWLRGGCPVRALPEPV